MGRSPTPARARCSSSAATLSSRAGGVLYLVTDRVRRAAAALVPPELRTLDAIHVASALVLGSDLAAVVTYDVRMPRAADRHRLRTLAPA